MADIAPHPPPRGDKTLWYSAPDKPDFRKPIAIALLGFLALGVLYVIAKTIPHPYAGYGLDLFFVLAAVTCFVVRRRRLLVIGILAVTIGAAVAVLHVRAIRGITIRDESQVAISRLDITLGPGAAIDFTGIPAGFAGKASLLLPGYDGGSVWVSGELANGKAISVSLLDAVFPSGQYHNNTLVIIHPDGSVTIRNH